MVHILPTNFYTYRDGPPRIKDEAVTFQISHMYCIKNEMWILFGRRQRVKRMRSYHSSHVCTVVCYIAYTTRVGIKKSMYKYIHGASNTLFININKIIRFEVLLFAARCVNERMHRLFSHLGFRVCMRLMSIFIERLVQTIDNDFCIYISNTIEQKLNINIIAVPDSCKFAHRHEHY